MIVGKQGCVIATLITTTIALVFTHRHENITGPSQIKPAPTSVSVEEALLPMGGAARLLAHDKDYEAYLEESLCVISDNILQSMPDEKWVERHLKRVGRTYLKARTSPDNSDDSNVYCILNPYQEVIVVGEHNGDWYLIEYNDRILYVRSEFITDIDRGSYDGSKLSPARARINGPSGSETYYNLDMTGVVRGLQSKGYKGEYSVREDGCKMFGDYIMVAANYDIHPYGSIVETSLGLGIVCDTGGFIKWNPTGLDIATDW